MNIYNKIAVLNQKYQVHNSNGEKYYNSNYKVIEGSIPILISAPHSVKQIRNGVEKAEDSNTGAIVEYLCSICNCYGFTRIYNQFDDPNSDTTGIGLQYKQKLVSIIKENDIKLLLDIHGCNNTHNFDFCIGTNNGRNLNGQYIVMDTLNIALKRIGIVAIDEYFKASSSGNISKYVSNNTNIPSIQLEISSKFRKESLYLEQLILCLHTAIDCIYQRNLLNYSNAIENQRDER